MPREEFVEALDGGWSAMRASTSASQACGSTSLSLAVMISVAPTAARSAPLSDPANSHALRPRAEPLSARSAALFAIARALMDGKAPDGHLRAIAWATSGGDGGRG